MNNCSCNYSKLRNEIFFTERPPLVHYRYWLRFADYTKVPYSKLPYYMSIFGFYSTPIRFPKVLAYWHNIQQIERHLASLGHFILTLSQPAFALTPYDCESHKSKCNSLWFDRICGIESTISHTGDVHTNHYTI